MRRTPRRWPRIIGLLLSLALGLLLAAVVMLPVMTVGGEFREGPYCSPSGIGADFPTRQNETELVYEESQWRGFPPSYDCRVYAVEHEIGGGGVRFRTSDTDVLHTNPHRLLAEGSQPKPRHYIWVLLALLLPPALWVSAQLISRTGDRLSGRSVSG